jgi:peptidoglycan L-alanyl-D-glutamate endopeptidase CwlK
MPAFSQRSLDVLATVKPDLRRLFHRVVLKFDCTILPDGGLRTPDRQLELYREGKSKTLQSKHLTGDAVDVAPYPVNWDMSNIENVKRWYAFCGYVRGVAEKLEIDVRGGFDWDSDFTFTDQAFHDCPHWELLP